MKLLQCIGFRLIEKELRDLNRIPMLRPERFSTNEDFCHYSLL
jgi:hypothetical protein